MRCKIPGRDLNARLNKTIIRYDDHPYLVITDENSLLLYEVDDPVCQKKIKKVHPDDELLDISTPPLGYFNSVTQNQAIYLVRLPVRMYKQGLCTQSLSCSLVSGLRVQGGVIHDRGYRDACQNVFPHVDTAMSMLRGHKTSSVAINRSVALAMDTDAVINVYFQQEVVGYIPKDSYTVHVPSDDRGWIVSMYLDGYGWEVD